MADDVGANLELEALVLGEKPGYLCVKFLLLCQIGFAVTSFDEFFDLVLEHLDL